MRIGASRREAMDERRVPEHGVGSHPMPLGRMRGLRTGGASLVVLVLCSTAAAAEFPAEDAKFDTKIWAIRATKDNEEVSPELKEVAEDLKKQTGCTGFRLEKKVEGQVEAGKELEGELLAGYKGTVSPLSKKEDRVQMKVSATKRVGDKDKPVFKTVVTVEAGKFQLTALGKLDKGEDLLIMAVAAE